MLNRMSVNLTVVLRNTTKRDIKKFLNGKLVRKSYPSHKRSLKRFYRKTRYEQILFLLKANKNESIY